MLQGATCRVRCRQVAGRGPDAMTTDYDKLTLRSIEAKRQLDQAEEGYQRAITGVDGVRWVAKRRRDLALQRYLTIEADRKRAAAPPAPETEAEPSPD